MYSDFLSSPQSVLLETCVLPTREQHPDRIADIRRRQPNLTDSAHLSHSPSHGPSLSSCEGGGTIPYQVHFYTRRLPHNGSGIV